MIALILVVPAEAQVSRVALDRPTCDAQALGRTYVILDAATVWDCTIGLGTEPHLCICDGTTWVSNLPDMFVEIAGDTMTGPLVVDVNDTAITMGDGAGTDVHILMKNASSESAKFGVAGGEPTIQRSGGGGGNLLDVKDQAGAIKLEVRSDGALLSDSDGVFGGTVQTAPSGLTVLGCTDGGAATCYADYITLLGTISIGAKGGDAIVWDTIGSGDAFGVHLGAPSSSTEIFVVEADGDVEVSRNLTLGGATPLLSALTLDGRNATGTTYGGGITLESSVSNLVIRTQDGLSRVVMLWNATPNPSKFITGGEDAFRLIFDGNGRLAQFWADGTGKIAGDTVTWVLLLDSNATDIQYKGTTLVNPAPPDIPSERVELTGPTLSVSAGSWSSPSAWGTEVEDTDTMYSTGGTITIKTAGTYAVTAYIGFTGSATALGCRIEKNGTTILTLGSATDGPSTVYKEFACGNAVTHTFAVNDTVGIGVKDLTTTTTPTLTTGRLAAVRVQ